MHAKNHVVNFEKFVDDADLATYPSALEHVSTWFIHNDVQSVEELAGTGELMGKFLLSSHGKVPLTPYYRMRRFLQKDLRKVPEPPHLQGHLPLGLGGSAVPEAFRGLAIHSNGSSWAKVLSQCLLFALWSISGKLAPKPSCHSACHVCQI